MGAVHQKQAEVLFKLKKCPFCVNGTKYIDYKNIGLLKRFTNYFSKIKQRYYTGVCLKHQKKLASAVKTARVMGLLSYVNE